METILVATDFSKPGNSAVEYAAHLARFLNTKLVIVHAFKLPLGGYNIEAPLDTVSEMRRSAENSLELIRDQLLHNSYDFGIEIHADLGRTIEVIKDVADKYNADLVVMGMTGEAGKIKQHVIGNTALNAANELVLPVLIISEHVTYQPIHHICLAAELQGIEESTLIYSARDVAQMFNATLEIVTVESADKTRKGRSPETYSFIDKKLKDLKHRQVMIHEEDRLLALEYYFKFHETDLVIVNPKKHSFFQELFGDSVTKHLAFHIRVPLLILK